MSSRRLALVVVIAAAAGGAALLAVGVFDGAKTAARKRSSEFETTAVPGPSMLELSAAAAERQEAGVEAPIFVAEQGEMVRGLVLHVDGAPCPGVEIEHIRRASKRLVARSDHTGSFEAVVADFEGRFAVVPGAFVAVTPPINLVRARRDELHVFVVARAVTVTGRVIDERGRGVAGATVGVRVPTEVVDRFPTSFARPAGVVASTISDAAGAFALQAFPGIAGSLLFASLEPLQPHGQELPFGDVSVIIVLRDPANARMVEGEVVDEHGEPLVDTKVIFGQLHASTRSDGVFRFAIDRRRWDIKPEWDLRACKAGHQPHWTRGFGRQVLESSRDATWLRLVLVAPDLTIEGRVIDARGNPCPISGVRVEWEDTRQWQWPCETTRTVNALDGGFAIRGLPEGELVLEFELTRPVLRFRSDPIRAGSSGVVLRVPADAVVPRIVGRVVAPDGSVIPRAEIGVSIGHWFLRNVPYAGAHERVDCDTAGGFELIDVPRRESALHVTHDSIVPLLLELDTVDLESELRVVVQRKCTLRIQGLPEDVHKARISLVDANGRQPFIELRNRPSGGGLNELELFDGASAALVVAEGRYTLNLRHGQDELLAREIELVAGQTTIVRP